jgi:hypothetical protein
MPKTTFAFPLSFKKPISKLRKDGIGPPLPRQLAPGGISALATHTAFASFEPVMLMAAAIVMAAAMPRNLPVPVLM